MAHNYIIYLTFYKILTINALTYEKIELLRDL